MLGEGGSSVVYAARWDATEVALKVIQSDGPITDADRARFLTEADRMKRVGHPSIVPLVGVGFLPDGRPWIAMPRLRGAPLADRTSQPIPAARALPLFFGVASGVGALHAAGLVHRDIKPQNVFWVDVEDRLILLDLGIAREIDASPSTTTRAGFSRGTPAYMAPERLFGHLASVRTDLYELALLLVVMLLGKLPWDEGDPHGRMLPQLEGTVIPPALVPVLSRALSLDVERRPASVDALLAQLSEAFPATTSGVIATAPTELVPSTRPAARVTAPREPALDTRAATPMPHAVIAASMAPAAAKSSGPVVLVLVAVGALGAVAAGALLFFRAAPAPAPAPVARALAADERVSSDAPTSEPTSAPSHAPTASESALAIETAETKPSAAVTPSPTPTSTAFASTSSTSAPTSTSPNASATNTTTSTAGAPAAIAACSQYVALMCDPKSGSTPAECAAAKTNSASWNKLPASAATETCQAAFSASKNGLALRREWKPPQN